MKLTTAQHLALDYQKNILVEAGAGSGKTTLFVERYLKILIENPSINPQNIIALTFTKKAASECQFRIYNRVYEAVKNKIIGKHLLDEIEKAPITTIHSFCSNLIKQNALTLNISPYFTVLTDVESVYLFKKACTKTIKKLVINNDVNLENYIEINSEKKLYQDLESCYKKQEKLISYSKTTIENLTPVSKSLLTIFLNVMTSYKTIKHKKNYLDYTDLISLTIQLLQDKQLQFHYSNNINYIMLDECQDIDPSQWHLITLLCQSKNFLINKKLFLVGDPKQCIYRFRGARLSFFSNLIDQFSSTKNHCSVVNLQENFRTNEAIINIINPLFKYLFNNQNSSLSYTPLKPTLNNPSSVRFGFLKNTTEENDEFYYIYTKVKQYLAQSKEKNIVILSRQRRHCEKLFRFLKAHNIPVQTDKQKGFFSQQLIIDCYLLIKTLVFPTDFLSWSSLLQSPFINFSQNLCHKILTTDKNTIIEKLDMVKTKYPNIKEVSKIQEKIKNWFNLLTELPLHDTLASIIKEAEIQHHIAQTPNGHYQVEIFLTILRSLESNQAYSPKDLLEILEFKLSMHDSSFDVPQTKNSRVNIMTIHAAKGLEFNHVILANCHHSFQMHFSESCLIENNFFHCNTNSTQDKEIRQTYFENEKQEIIEEEKRLFYVACTRAKETLILTGLYKKTPKTKHFSYLSFITTLPGYKEELNIISFSDNSKTINVQCDFQINNSKENNNDNISFQHLLLEDVPYKNPHNTRKTFSYSPSQIINSSKKETVLTLNALASQQAGTLIHECIMSLITKKAVLSELLTFCHTSPLYIQLDTETQQEITKTLQMLYTSSLLSNYQSLKLQLEETIAIKLNDTEIHARFDGIYIDNEAATLLEIKTDKISDLQTLLNQYKEQLNIYCFCIFKHYNINKINVILYSSFLNKNITYLITNNVKPQLEEKIQALLLNMNA
jgi:ATP-dependent helicase/nuclease subunit A